MRSNIRVPEDVQDAGRVANRTAHHAASSRWMTVLARLGLCGQGYRLPYYRLGSSAVGAGRWRQNDRSEGRSSDHL